MVNIMKIIIANKQINKTFFVDILINDTDASPFPANNTLRNQVLLNDCFDQGYHSSLDHNGDEGIKN